MNVEPIIDARFKKFRESYDLGNLSDDDAFERFVNHTILSTHQPDAFGADAQLLDSICVGGTEDTGIDGIGVKLNGLFVKDEEEVKDIIEKFPRVSVEFIFIQSKSSTTFDTSGFNKFVTGVRDFLSEDHHMRGNEKINLALQTKDYLLCDDVVSVWESSPTVRLYYVAMGKWRKSKHLLALAEKMKEDVSKLSTYGDCQIHFVDAEALKTICNNNENTFSSSIEAIDTMHLTAVEGVENSCIALCYAGEFLKLLTTEEGVIRKSLFDDNVRDYQGVNSVNAEIEHTVTKEPEKFGLLNNGITIVCDEFILSNRRITIKNPQIVNGCQTSHVLFYTREKWRDAENVPLQIKIISTKNLDITNQVVRGTNRQNIVLDETFETTRKFHKDLEEFFQAVGPEYERIYYERRSKQFQHDPRIRQTDKVNLRILTQFMVGMFLNQPHMSHRHEAKLLKEFEDKIYQEHQSKLPYYTAALAFVKMEKLFRYARIDKRIFYSFRAHLSMVVRELAAGATPSLNDERGIDKYCTKVLKVLCDDTAMKNTLDEALGIFEKARRKWIGEMRRSPDGIKDIPDFTTVLLRESGTPGVVAPATTKDDDIYFGTVIKVIVDRNGQYCGFIRRRSGEDVFFHSQGNPDLSFDSLEDTPVSYGVIENPVNGRPLGLDVRIVEDLRESEK